MKLRLFTFLTLAFCTISTQAADILAKYTPTTSGGTKLLADFPNSGQVAYSSPSAFAFGGGAAGAGGTACGAGDANLSVTTAGIVNTEAAAVSANDFVTFTVNLTGLNAKFKTTSSYSLTATMSSSGSGCNAARVYYAYGAGSFTAAGSASTITRGSCKVAKSTISVSIPAPAGTTETALTIRIYMWGATAAATSTYTRIGSVQLTSPVVLPVTWTYAEAIAENMGNLVKWGTASEYDNERFDIEYSSTGENFRVLASVPGAGNSVSPLDYSYTHKAPDASRLYYRIRQIDYNGKSAYSPIFSADNKWVTDIVAYPIPATDVLHVMLPEVAAQSTVSYRIVNMQGAAVGNGFTEASQHLSIPTSALPAGVYILELESGQRIRFTR